MEPFKESEIHFEVDLPKTALYHLSFLKEVDSATHLRQDDILFRALQRYEKFWLPLAAKFDKEKLTAPLDIEWMWHCHMLCPNAYVRDCHDLVGKVIDHELVSPIERKQRLLKSQTKWKELYPHEPFEITVDSGAFGFDQKIFKSSLSYDLINASKRQSVFFYQVSLPHYSDSYFLENAVLRYKKFLFLKKNNPKMFLVPCYDIDLVWHTHLLHPAIYKKDTEEILGILFNHDDTANDRSPDSRRSQSDLETRELWRNTFHETFSLHGAMYRGDPPAGKLYHLNSSEIFAFSSKKALVVLNNVNIEGVTCEKGKLKLKVSLIERKDDKVLFKLKGTQPSWNFSESYTFDTLHPVGLRFELTKRTGISLFGSTERLGQYKADPLSYIDFFKNGQSEALEIRGRIWLYGLGSNNITVSGHIYAPQRSISVFQIEPGQYNTANVPENIEQMWGPVPLQKLPPNTENTCNVASHSIRYFYAAFFLLVMFMVYLFYSLKVYYQEFNSMKQFAKKYIVGIEKNVKRHSYDFLSLFNHNGQLTFTCRILHSIPLMMSAIHVFYHDKMAVVGHIIGSDQLPLPSQVNHE
ncbi:hypothetical protein KUTeg_004757 [Tegillarca granosa]|uniref:Uncharacterized protein n=1 Tax=Tegillarca granosa TaxID=220873 RepID=A0ABQ9FHS2_TEGGR|nr:hypothetical protein KUTeg_004757 [Tegillarca granosa]